MADDLDALLAEIQANDAAALDALLADERAALDALLAEADRERCEPQGGERWGLTRLFKL